MPSRKSNRSFAQMIRTYSISLLFILVEVSLHAQSIQVDLLKQAEYVGTVNGLTHFRNGIRFQIESTDTLNLGAVEIHWSIKKGRKLLDKTHLVTLSNGDSIIYRAFYQQKLTGDLDTCIDDCWTYRLLHKYTDSTQLSRLLSRATAHNLHVDLSHLEPFRSAFGYSCFFDASMPREGQKMLELIQSKNHEELTHWLYSINPVKQAYAYLGFRLLQNRDSLHLDSSTIQKLKDLPMRSTKLYTCSGCTIWTHQSMQSQLTEGEVNAFLASHRR